MRNRQFSQKEYRRARRVLGNLGIQLLWTPWEHEYRVTFKRGTPEEREDRAYYTDDLKDAVGTGLAMAKVQLPSQQPVTA